MDQFTEITSADLAHCTRVLESVAKNLSLLSPLKEEDRIRLLIAAGQVVTPDKHVVRQRLKASRRAKWEAKRQIDRSVRATTSIRTARVDAVFVAPPRLIVDDSVTSGRPELQQPRGCYICKTEFTKLHHFYDALCPSCAVFNYDKRFQTAPLAGRMAVITGARLKIGYQAGLMLLRAGCRVIVSTRFPQDSALRYSKEPDFKDWSNRLQIHGLDLRHSPSVEAFTRYLDRKLERLDFLINNAAQTVRRPPGFYRHLLEIEARPHAELPVEARGLLLQHEEFKAMLRGQPESAAGDGTTWVSEWHQGRRLDAPGVTDSAQLSQIPYACEEAVELDPALFPAGRYDSDLQQVDLRPMNSWRMALADVPTAELLEVQLVNAVAPFILCSKLKPLMMRTPGAEKHIVNVSAIEGQFNRHTKTDKHPHTNMAKAALNMLTLTSARDCVRDGIYMNAVDTGWVTDEDPADLSARKQRDHDFQPPLDIVDGAARILDPIFSGILTGQHAWGNFLKDYVPTRW